MSLQRFTRRELVTIGPDRPAEEAAKLMRGKHVGAVIVVDDGKPIGIVTDRDLVIRLLADWSPGTPVRAVMTRDVIVAKIDDALDFAFYTMRQHGVRRLPIVNDDGALVGLVAVDDLLVLLGGEVSSIVETVVDNRGP